MAFQQYKFDDEIFGKLPFLGELIRYIYRTSAGKFCEGALFEMTQPNWRKAETRLCGKMEGELVAKDKVYLLPQSSIPLFKLKAHLKAVGASFTTEVAEATKIIGHKKVSDGGAFLGASHSSLLKVFMAPIWLHNPINHIRGKDQSEQLLFEFDKDIYEHRLNKDLVKLPELENRSITKTLIANEVQKQMDAWLSSSSITEYMITPQGAIILYHHMDKNIPIISEDQIFKQIGKPLIIDDDSFETIMQMLQSSDQNNHKTAAEILANCDYKQSLYYLWEIARSDDRYIGQKVNNLHRFKNIQLFLAKSGWYSLMHADPETMAERLRQAGLLTEKIYLKIADEMFKSYADYVETRIFDVALTPSKEFAQFAPADFKLEFGHPKPLTVVADDEEEEDLDTVEEDDEDDN